MASKRFLIVPEDSSAARMPRPGATMASATLLSSARFMGTAPCLFSVPLLRGLLPNPNPGSTAGAQRFHTRQLAPLEPFEERAAGGRHIGKARGHLRGIERCDRVAAT